MLIRPARPEDSEAIWKILRPVIRAAETYALPPDMTRRTALAYWPVSYTHLDVYKRQAL